MDEAHAYSERANSHLDEDHRLADRERVVHGEEEGELRVKLGVAAAALRRRNLDKELRDVLELELIRLDADDDGLAHGGVDDLVREVVSACRVRVRGLEALKGSAKEQDLRWVLWAAAADPAIVVEGRIKRAGLP